MQETLSGLAAPATGAAPAELPDVRRRLTYLMAFRVALISLVLGATTFLYWLGNSEPWAPGALVLYAVIAATYLLTIVYALALRRNAEPGRLALIQLGIDLVIASLLMHATGGVQSAYSFFFPLTVIGAATVTSRDATAWVAGAAALLFIAIGLLGWAGALPSLPGQEIRPHDLTAIEVSRAIGLNLAAIVGVSVLALTLSGQLQRTSASLAVERTAAADLLTLHADIVRCLSSGLVTVNPRDRVIAINESAAEMLEASQERAIGSSLEQVLPGMSDLLRELGEHGSIQRGELTLARTGRPDLVLGISVSPLFDHGGGFLGRVVNFQDLTELRKMEQSVKQKERLASLGALAAGVAHEIRNPLASISGSIELLRQTPQVDEDSQALMSIVTREIDRLNGLITDLLDYASPRPLKVAPVDLVELVRDTVRVFEQDRTLLSGVALELVGADELGTLPMAGDAAVLRQVLWNLLRNAAEAAGQGGGHVAIEIERGAEEAEIRVRDDGPGIPREHQRRVFEPFFSTKSKGTGLGLATVHNLVTDHRGTVRFETQPGRGTCFVVRLPYTVRKNRPSGPPELGDEVPEQTKP